VWAGTLCLLQFLRSEEKNLACRSSPGSIVEGSEPQGGAMKYLMFIRHSESDRESPPPPALMEAMGKFVKKSLAKGTLVDTGGLLPSKDGVRLRLADGKITVRDGPFSESKEVIGGWAIVKADSKAEALEIASEFMELHRKYWPGFDCESEVRPMFDPGMGP
jgi:hypothetical protein